jgi:hypothetical protein
MTQRIQAALLATLLAFLLLPAASARSVGDFHGFSQAELDQLVAPVALYPDTVLSHVLIAATYPLEVVKAARWTRDHPDLVGHAAVEAVIDYPWDPSVMALVAFPELLARMDADLDWTQRLGDAFLVQEEELLNSIQRLRGHAHRAGHLASNEHVQVVREREVIYIEPARREVIYLPYYNPRVVYGRWHWADYPPVVWHYPRRHHSAWTFYWSPAYRVAPTFFFSSFHWSRRQVVVVHHHHHYYRPSHYSRPRSVAHRHIYSGRDLARLEAAQRWHHEPSHRRGVAYRAGVPDRHRQASVPSGRQAALARPGTAPARTAETRSQQRQWAAERRSATDRPALSASQPRADRASTGQRNVERRLGTMRSASAQSAEPLRRPSTSAQRATSRPDRVGGPATTRSTHQSARAVPDRSLVVERRRSDRSTSSAPPARRTSPAVSRSTAQPRAALPSISRAEEASPALRATERSRSSTVRGTAPVPDAAARAAVRNRSAVRQVAPSSQRSGARVGMDRSSSRPAQQTPRSKASRISERSAARRRD